MGTDQLSDAQRYAASECGDLLTRLNGMGKRLLRLLAHPAHDRDAGVPEYHERVLGEAHDTRKFKLDDLVQCLDRLVLVDLHGGAPSIRPLTG